jgi:hypothetical protein
MELQKEPGETTIFWLLPTPKVCESIILGAPSVEPFYKSYFKKAE